MVSKYTNITIPYLAVACRNVNLSLLSYSAVTSRMQCSCFAVNGKQAAHFATQLLHDYGRQLW